MFIVLGYRDIIEVFVLGVKELLALFFWLFRYLVFLGIGCLCIRFDLVYCFRMEEFSFGKVRIDVVEVWVCGW